MAIKATRAHFTSSNPAYTTLELYYHVDASHAKYIISKPSILASIVVKAKSCNISNAATFVIDAYEKASYYPQHYRQWELLSRHSEEDWVEFKAPYKETRFSTAPLAFMCGTTGLSKVAMIAKALFP